APARPAVRWPAAARRHRPRRRHRPDADRRRRADRRPRRPLGRRNPEPAQRAAPVAAKDDHPGHARPAGRPAGGTARPPGQGPARGGVGPRPRGGPAAMKFFLLVLKNLSRNKARTALTALAVVFLVVIFSMIVTVLRFLNLAMAAQSKDVPIVVTERYRFPSRFDRRYIQQIALPGGSLHNALRSLPGFRPEQYNWRNLVAFSLDTDLKDSNVEFVAIPT